MILLCQDILFNWGLSLPGIKQNLGESQSIILWVGGVNFYILFALDPLVQLKQGFLTTHFLVGMCVFRLGFWAK